MPNDLIIQSLIALASAGAVYGGIRADLKAHAEGIKAAAEAAKAAHHRIDNHLEKHRA
jgi:outer membrane murein-binding lipoprotein Lpp